MSQFRRREHPALEVERLEQAQRRACDWPDCGCPGEYRAPRSRTHLREFYHFCLDHVRAYNRAWDFFTGMSQPEIEAYMREDVTWHRPTWPLGNGQPPHPEAWRWQDPYELFLGGAGTNGTHGASEWDRRQGRLGRTERMLAVLDLPPDVTCRSSRRATSSSPSAIIPTSMAATKKPRSG
jgi:hypothetical protein